MFIALLRASARTFDPTAFLDAHVLEAETIWRAGELGPGGRVRPESGFLVTIARAPSPRELMPALKAWVEVEVETLRALAEEGAAPVIDLRVTVPADPAMIASMAFEPADLSMLGVLGVGLRVSASTGEQ